jgi:hypothetical protein
LVGYIRYGLFNAYSLLANYVADRLWVDIYEPQDEVRIFTLQSVNSDSFAVQKTLAVHNKKVDDVRAWLDQAFTGGPTGKLRKYRVSILSMCIDVTEILR